MYVLGSILLLSKNYWFCLFKYYYYIELDYCMIYLRFFFCSFFMRFAKSFKINLTIYEFIDAFEPRISSTLFIKIDTNKPDIRSLGSIVLISSHPMKFQLHEVEDFILTWSFQYKIVCKLSLLNKLLNLYLRSNVLLSLFWLSNNESL